MKPDSKKSVQSQNATRPVKTEVERASVVEGTPAARATESAEPKSGSAQAPIWLIIVLGGLFYWGQIYLDENAGGFNRDVYGSYRSFKEVEAANPKDENALFIARGQALYSQACAGCHQPSGQGTPGATPPLAGSEWVLATDPSRLIRIPMHGLTGPIEVKGQRWDASMLSMWSVFDAQSDPENALAATLSYVRQAWGNKAPIVKAEQVKAVREATDGRTTPWTESELLQVPLQQ